MACRFMKKVLSLGLGVLSFERAEATTVTATPNVTLTVLASCTVQSATLAFPPFSGLASLTQTGTIRVTCTQTTPYFVQLGPGTGSGATTTNRLMTSGGNTVKYRLFKDSNLTINWGDTGAERFSGIGTSTPQDLTVYGNIPAPQTSPAGSYMDTVLITVTY